MGRGVGGRGASREGVTRRRRALSPTPPSPCAPRPSPAAPRSPGVFVRVVRRQRRPRRRLDGGATGGWGGGGLRRRTRRRSRVDTQAPPWRARAPIAAARADTPLTPQPRAPRPPSCDRTARPVWRQQGGEWLEGAGGGGGGAQAAARRRAAGGQARPRPSSSLPQAGGGGGNPFANMGGLMENMRKAQEEAARVQVELSK